MNTSDVTYEFCKSCENLISCVELIRASDLDFKVDCPCFEALSKEVRYESRK